MRWWWGARAGGTAEEAMGQGGEGRETWGETWGETSRLAATAAKFLSCFGLVGGANGNAYRDTEDGQMDVRRESRGEGCGPVCCTALNDVIFGGGEGSNSTLVIGTGAGGVNLTNSRGIFADACAFWAANPVPESVIWGPKA